MTEVTYYLAYQVNDIIRIKIYVKNIYFQSIIIKILYKLHILLHFKSHTY